MSIKIIHPDGLTGSAAGMQFNGGVAVASSLSKDARAVLGTHGYKFENVKDEPSAAEKSETVHVTGEKVDEANLDGEPAAVVELADGTVVGDGVTIATLPTEGTRVEDALAEPTTDAPAEKPAKDAKK